MPVQVRPAVPTVTKSCALPCRVLPFLVWVGSVFGLPGHRGHHDTTMQPNTHQLQPEVAEAQVVEPHRRSPLDVARAIGASMTGPQVAIS